MKSILIFFVLEGNDHDSPMLFCSDDQCLEKIKNELNNQNLVPIITDINRAIIYVNEQWF